MQTTMALAGFVALLALVAAALAAWLTGRLTDRVGQLERKAAALAEECRMLHCKLEQAADTPQEIPAGSFDTGMNLSKRVQILRLHRRGETATHIASVLSLPLAQVELVLKLQRQAAEAGPYINANE